MDETAVSRDGTLWFGLDRTTARPGGLYRVRPGERRPTLVTALRATDFTVAVTPHYVWVRPNVTFQSRQTLYQYDAATGRLVTSYSMLSGSGPFTATGDDVWSVSGSPRRQSALLISGTDRRVERTVPISHGRADPTHAAAAGGFLFVSVDGLTTLLRIGMDGRTTVVRSHQQADRYMAVFYTSGRTAFILSAYPDPLPRDPLAVSYRTIAVDAGTLAEISRTAGNREAALETARTAVEIRRRDEDRVADGRGTTTWTIWAAGSGRDVRGWRITERTGPRYTATPVVGRRS
jgi:hypothetical protein